MEDPMENSWKKFNALIKGPFRRIGSPKRQSETEHKVEMHCGLTVPELTIPVIL